MKPKRYKIGMRCIKTAAAIGLSMSVCALLDRSGLLYAGIAAVMCMQHTPSESFRSGIERLIATTAGAVAAFVILEISTVFPYYHEFGYLLLIPAGALLTIYMTLLLNRSALAGLAAVVFLCITVEPAPTLAGAGLYVFWRYLGTVIGVVCTGLVNRLIAPLHEHEDPA